MLVCTFLVEIGKFLLILGDVTSGHPVYTIVSIHLKVCTALKNNTKRKDFTHNTYKKLIKQDESLIVIQKWKRYSEVLCSTAFAEIFT